MGTFSVGLMSPNTNQPSRRKPYDGPPMKLEVIVAEFKELFNSLQSPDELFELMRVDLREEAGNYLPNMIFFGKRSYSHACSN